MRCGFCGALLEKHKQDHLCRFHWDEDGVCTVCGTIKNPCYMILSKPCIGHRIGCSMDCPNNKYF